MNISADVIYNVTLNRLFNTEKELVETKAMLEQVIKENQELKRHLESCNTKDSNVGAVME